MKTLAIITARGGSKRISRKNIKDFLGKPIIAYSIEAALLSGVFDEVMVSTDDTDIAEIAKKYGAKIPFMRSEATANDFATTQEVIAEVIGEYELRGQTFDAICCIYPTAPFVTSRVLKKGMDCLFERNVDTVMPIVAFSFPPQRAVEIKEDKINYVYPQYSVTRSQDLTPQYHDCGQFYCFKVDAFQQQKCLIMKHTYPLILDELQVQDIDNEIDWELAELKYKLLLERKGEK